MDQFSRDAALVGVAGSLSKIDEGLTGALTGQKRQIALASNDADASAGKGTPDTTVRQLTDTSSSDTEG